MNGFEIIEQSDDSVVMKVNRQYFTMFYSMIQSQLNNEECGVSQDFLRRIVPFFMNQFLIWAMQTNEDNLVSVRITLMKIKENKKSNQRKFELGDLKKIHNPKDIKKYKLVREAWESFLYSQHIRDCIQHNKRIKLGSIVQYMEAINILILELDKPFPYNKLLSKYKQGVKNKTLPVQQFQPYQDEFSILQEDENSTCFTLGRLH
ncbi:unnamed protein product (macronuclear) [Paramecium tetraurelia]|uniref:Uncharacterized protein n=1 Tax=Paramecium tetraurelia TaxID=5888 RepID=A0C7Q1_PARTE|nr:uncharacterized protein GSPATT00035949001 [Paramecium tetraurelia]CAK66818.1 unnamed protein product [Paramecium tetraurelia]|eukprot:XP_001434215.1 hypothetical protein (macronuclear) [Paramecium tetraurelia strain d4-2]